MSIADSEHYLEKARTVRNLADKRGKLVQKAIRYLTFRERRAREEEMASIKGTLDQPLWALKDISSQGRADLIKRRNFLEDDLADNGPPTDIGDKTQLYLRVKELRSEIQSCLLTQETMRRNAAGAVDAYNRGENSPQMKAKILEYKNLLRLIEPDNDEKDYTNIELLRPSGLSAETAATFMMNAQIPGNFAMTPLAKSNWPLGDPKVDTPLKQAERQEVAEEMIKDGVAQSHEIEELKAALKEAQERLAAIAQVEAKKEGKKKASQEASARMKKYWADRKAKAGSVALKG